MKEAILKGDFEKFAKYLGESWESKKRTASVISNEQINLIYDTAIKHGAKAGKVSGAGGGGFMMFVVDPVKKMEVIEALKTFNGKIMNAQFTTDGAQAWTIKESNIINIAI